MSAKVSSFKIFKVLLTTCGLTWAENTLNSHSCLCLNYLTIISLAASAVVAGIRPAWFEPNSQFSTFQQHVFSMQSCFQYLLKITSNSVLFFFFLSAILSDANQEKSGAGLLFMFVINYYNITIIT